MNKRPGHVNVTTEVAYCSFCGRPRTLRREEHQLGTLVRTIVTCETCHRTLSSSIGVASTEPVAAEETKKVEEPMAAASAPKPAAKKPAVKQLAQKPAVKKPAVRKPAATKPAAKKPVSTAKKAAPKKTAPKKK